MIIRKLRHADGTVRAINQLSDFVNSESIQEFTPDPNTTSPYPFIARITGVHEEGLWYDWERVIKNFENDWDYDKFTDEHGSTADGQEAVPVDFRKWFFKDDIVAMLWDGWSYNIISGGRDRIVGKIISYIAADTVPQNRWKYTVRLQTREKTLGTDCRGYDHWAIYSLDDIVARNITEEINSLAGTQGNGIIDVTIPGGTFEIQPCPTNNPVSVWKEIDWKADGKPELSYWFEYPNAFDGECP